MGSEMCIRDSIYKIYAESFKGEDHLNAIQSEAQEIVGQALTQSAKKIRFSAAETPTPASAKQPAKRATDADGGT